MTESSLYTTVTKSMHANFIMIKAYKEMLAPDEHTGATTQMLLLGMYDKAKKIHYENRMPQWVNIIHESINDHWNEKFTLMDLSNASSMHPVTISRYFPRYFSCTLGEYLRKLKIEKSIYLINSGKAALTDIAYSCGFAERSHFTRNFREIIGYTPRQYQKLSLSKKEAR